MYSNTTTRMREEIKFRAPQHVFVYGTLKKTFFNNYILDEGEDALYCGEFYTKRPDYLMYSAGGFPMVTKAKDHKGYHIKGELYLVNKPVLRRMDSLEGHPFWYERKRILLDDGTIASTYLMPSDGVHGYRTVPVVQHTDEGIRYQEWKKGMPMSLKRPAVPPLSVVPTETK